MDLRSDYVGGGVGGERCGAFLDEGHTGGRKREMKECPIHRGVFPYNLFLDFLLCCIDLSKNAAGSCVLPY